MCGLFGFWLHRPLSENDILFGRKGTAMLAHRGPDRQGEWFNKEEGIYFGHRRLSVVDLSTGSDQPMSSEDTVVAFNGEIYNFPELREELSSYGRIFSTSGDTEVLLAAWEYWGADCLGRFDGMFSIAFFDSSGLHLVTDIFGEKPLYVAKMRDGYYFASEPQALISLLQLSFSPGQKQIEQFLSLGFIPSPNTGYPDLEWLPSGTLRSYSKAGEVKQFHFYPLDKATASGNRKHWTESDIDDLCDILLRLLRRRLRADVPTGLFLSSGVDSALIGALASRELGVELPSMTVSFMDGEDEAPFASLIARHLGLPHKIIDSRTDERWRSMPQELAELYGLPNDNVSGLFVREMSRLARRDMVVALTGLGGDEIFYGYNKYKFLHRNRWIYKMPHQLFGGDMLDSVLCNRIQKLSTIRRLLRGNSIERFLALKNQAIGDLLRSSAIEIPDLPYFGSHYTDLLKSVRNFDVAQTLPASYAAAVDRGSMRASVEVRTPYLSRELFEFTSKFSVGAMFENGSKTPLRRLIKRYLPENLVNHPKRGFVFPLNRFMKQVSEASPTVSGIDADTVSTVWTRRHEPGYSEVALRLLVLDHFFKKFK